MTHAFDPAVVDAVLAHMNADHLEDNLLIVRAHGVPEATAASMSDADGEAGTWHLASKQCTLVTTADTTHSVLGHLFLACLTGR